MQSKPTVSVVIGSYNRLEFIKSTINSVREELNKVPYEIIVVDGGSSDGTKEWLVEQKDIITIIQHNRGEWLDKKIERKSWGYFMNLGFKSAQGKYICMLSDDCLVIPGAIRNAVEEAEVQIKLGTSVGAVAFYWRNWPEQKDYWVGVAFGDRLFVNHGLYLKEALEKVNFVDEDSYFFYHADGDLSLRIWDAGYVCIDSPNSYIEHYSDANTEVRISNLDQQQADWKTYTDRWAKLGKPEKDWLEKSFKDRHRTAQKYWQQEKSFIKRLVR